jgi:hypothetical protein
METLAISVDAFDIPNPPHLDRITVILERWGKELPRHAGRITILCYGRAWCASWGSMGMPLEEFVTDNHPDYVVDNLLWGTEPILKKGEAKYRAYLARIVCAVQEALRARLAADEAPNGEKKDA